MGTITGDRAGDGAGDPPTSSFALWISFSSSSGIIFPLREQQAVAVGTGTRRGHRGDTERTGKGQSTHLWSVATGRTLSVPMPRNAAPFWMEKWLWGGG